MENKEQQEERALTLKEKQNLLVDSIINEDDYSKTKEMIDLFNINIAKKNVARVNTLNNLLDKINDQAIERFDKRPEEVSNKDLLDYMNTVQTQIEKSNNAIKSLNETPPIQLNQQNINVNITNKTDAASLDRESRKRILDAIQAIIGEEKQDDDVIDVETNKVE